MWSADRPPQAQRPDRPDRPDLRQPRPPLPLHPPHYRAEARQLLLVLRADAVDAGWWTPSGWQTVQVPVPSATATATAPTPATGGAPQDAAPGAADPSTALRHMQALLADPACGLRGQPGRVLTVLVAPPWLTEGVLPWSDGLLRPASAEPQSRSALAAQGHVPAPDAVLRIDHRPPLGRPRSALLVPGALLPALQALALSIGARLASVQSQAAVAACWAARQPVPVGAAGRPALVGLMDAAGLRLAGRDGTAALAGQTLVDAGAAGAVDDRGASAARLWQRARLRFPALQAVAVLPVLTLDAPPPGPSRGAPVAAPATASGAAPASAAGTLAWLPWPSPGPGAAPGAAARRSALDRALLRQALRQPTLDALARRPGPAPAWQAAAALCLLAATGLALWAWQTRADLLAARTAGAAPAVQASEAPPTRAELAELRAVNGAIGQLNLPLARLLRTLQPPRDIAVSLLGLDLSGRSSDDQAPATPIASVSPATGNGASAGPAGLPPDGLGTAASLKLSVEAASAADMTRYLAFLAGRDGIRSVQLLRHEIDSPQAAGPYRFTLDVAWQR